MPEEEKVEIVELGADSPTVRKGQLSGRPRTRSVEELPSDATEEEITKALESAGRPDSGISDD